MLKIFNFLNIFLFIQYSILALTLRQWFWVCYEFWRNQTSSSLFSKKLRELKQKNWKLAQRNRRKKTIKNRVEAIECFCILIWMILVFREIFERTRVEVVWLVELVVHERCAIEWRHVVLFRRIQHQNLARLASETSERSWHQFEVVVANFSVFCASIPQQTPFCFWSWFEFVFFVQKWNKIEKKVRKQEKFNIKKFLKWI